MTWWYSTCLVCTGFNPRHHQHKQKFSVGSTPLIPASERQRWSCESEASQGCTVRPYLESLTNIICLIFKPHFTHLFFCVHAWSERPMCRGVHKWSERTTFKSWFSLPSGFQRSNSGPLAWYPPSYLSSSLESLLSSSKPLRVNRDTSIPICTWKHAYKHTEAMHRCLFPHNSLQPRQLHRQNEHCSQGSCFQNTHKLKVSVTGVTYHWPIRAD